MSKNKDFTPTSDNWLDASKSTFVAWKYVRCKINYMLLNSINYTKLLAWVYSAKDTQNVC